MRTRPTAQCDGMSGKPNSDEQRGCQSRCLRGRLIDQNGMPSKPRRNIPNHPAPRIRIQHHPTRRHPRLHDLRNQVRRFRADMRLCIPHLRYHVNVRRFTKRRICRHHRRWPSPSRMRRKRITATFIHRRGIDRTAFTTRAQGIYPTRSLAIVVVRQGVRAASTSKYGFSPGLTAITKGSCAGLRCFFDGGRPVP
jgi:hypothetical protein